MPGTLGLVERPAPTGELILAWAAGAVGVIGIVSALTPELANRFDFVRGVLPPGVPSAARVAALAFGLALVWLARSLARRRRRAWQLSLALVFGISVAHLAKGLDVEEALMGAALLFALIRYRRRFDVPGDSETRPLLITALALAALGASTLVLELRGFEHDRLEDLLVALTAVLAFRAFYLWLRALSHRVRQSAEERRTVRRLVRDYGDDSLAFFSLRKDKTYFFSPSRRSFLAYRVVAGCALVSGDPVGVRQELGPLLAEFRRVCHARGWRLALLSVRSDLLPIVHSLGLHSIKIGDEAVVRPATFRLEGRAIRKVRQSVTRLERAGYRFRVVPTGDVDAPLREQLVDVSDVWRGASAERGFSMAMDDFFGEHETLFAVAERGDEVGGFLHLVPSLNGFSLGAMRRRPTTPNGLMEFLIASLLVWARERGTAEVSLNFCVFSDFLGDDAESSPAAVFRRILRVGDRIFQLERLLVFSRKFGPEWRPRYLCFERLTDLPPVGLAYLRVESLLTPPGPWTRRSDAEGVLQGRLSD
jgi:lysyl-tRNA synthetase, class II